MRRYLVRNLLIAGLIVLVIVISLFSLLHGLGRADYGKPTVIRNQPAPITRGAQVLGPTDSQKQLTLAVGLQTQNATTLTNLVSAVNNPHSPLYHHFLTPDQFKQRFAPTSDQVQEVTNYLQQQGLTITDIATNNLLVHATGTVAQIEQAFKVQINDYKSGGQVFYANALSPSVPEKIRALITSITGLDNIARFHPQHLALSPSTEKSLTPTGYGPQDLAGAYDLSSLHNAGIWGDNQTIALLEMDGYQPSDITHYVQYYKLNTASTTPTPTSTPTPVTTTPTPGATPTSTPIGTATATASPSVTPTPTTLPTSTPTPSPTQVPASSSATVIPQVSSVKVDGFSGSAGQAATEVELDMEVAAAVAPHANQLVYEGPDTDQGFDDLVNQIITDNRAQIVSISWARACESTLGSANIQTLDGMFMQGAAQGMSFFAASGDAGAYGCLDNNLAVDYPASDPYVTGIGGTTLQMQSGTYIGETAWSNPNDILHGPHGAGSGGGLSSIFQQPSWQSAPGVQNSYSNGMREVPDVSADANSRPGYAVYCTVQNAGCSTTGWMHIGGTSAAAPLWAASVALINQYLSNQGKSPIGQANPTLYTLASTQQPFTPYHTITQGNNLYYPATAGYNLATGLGSPDVYNIARDLAGTS